jgi:hypothetical protein
MIPLFASVFPRKHITFLEPKFSGQGTYQRSLRIVAIDKIAFFSIRRVKFIKELETTVTLFRYTLPE